MKLTLFCLLAFSMTKLICGNSFNSYDKIKFDENPPVFYKSRIRKK